MDQLRQKQYNEVLNEDRDINLEVMKRTRRQIEVYNQDIIEQQSGNPMSLIEFNKMIEKLNDIFQIKIALFDNITKLPMDKDKRVFDLVNMSSIIITFNDIIRFLLNPANNNTNRNIYNTNLMALEEIVATIYQGYINLFNKISTKNNADVIKIRFLNSILSSRSVMDLLFKQFYNNNFQILTYTDIMVNYNKILKELDDNNQMFIQNINDNIPSDRKKTLNNRMLDYEDELGRTVQPQEKFFLFNDDASTFDRSVLLPELSQERRSPPGLQEESRGMIPTTSNINELREFIQKKIDEIPDLFEYVLTFSSSNIDLFETQKMRNEMTIKNFLSKINNRINEDYYDNKTREDFMDEITGIYYSFVEYINLMKFNSSDEFKRQLYDTHIEEIHTNLVNMLEELLNQNDEPPPLEMITANEPPQVGPNTGYQALDPVVDTSPLLTQYRSIINAFLESLENYRISTNDHMNTEYKNQNITFFVRQLNTIYTIFLSGDSRLNDDDKEELYNFLSKIIISYEEYLNVISPDSDEETKNLFDLIVNDLSNELNLYINKIEVAYTTGGNKPKKNKRKYVKKLMIKPSIDPIIEYNEQDNDPFMVTFK